MSKRLPLAPVTGHSGAAAPFLGAQPVAVTFRMFVEIWEPGDPPFRTPRTLGDLKRKYKWDPAASTLTVPHTATEAFTLGADVLAGLPDSTPMRLQMMYGPGVGPTTVPPKQP